MFKHFTRSGVGLTVDASWYMPGTRLYHQQTVKGAREARSQLLVCLAGGGEVSPSAQAHAYIGSAPDNNFLPMFPAMPTAQLQHAMAAWGPYLALYQMQSMMGAPISGPLGVGVGPFHEQAAAQQAQHAFMLALHQMAHSQSPGALPHSLGIAIGAASQGPSGSAALVPRNNNSLQGIAA